MPQSIVPLWGKDTIGRSTNVTGQRRINMYAEVYGDPDKTPRALYTRPGLNRKYFKVDNVAGSQVGTPFRGVHTRNTNVSGGPSESVYAAQGNLALLATTLNRFLPGSPMFLSTMGPVQFASIGVQIIAVDGVTGYIPTNGTTMYQEGVTDFPAARSICTLAQRFIVEDPAQTGVFRYSDVNNMLSWPSLNFFTAESFDDPLVLVFSVKGELLLFGTRSIEFWQPSEDVFSPVSGATQEWGLGYFDTVRDLAGNCFFVGRAGGEGQPQVCGINGYQIQPISTPDIDYTIAQEVLKGAVPTATTITFGGHAWYVLNLLNTSFAYDLTTGTWDEWRTDGKRWAGQYQFSFKGLTFVTDYRDGRVYVLDVDSLYDDDVAMVREFTTRHAFTDLDEMSLRKLELDIETGVGLPIGQGVDPKVMLQFSKDGGHTWSSEIWRDMRKQGYYKGNPCWRNLGTADDWMFRFRVTDPVKTVFMNAACQFAR